MGASLAPFAQPAGVSERYGGRPVLRPLLLGALAAFALLAFYLGVITLAQGWAHALNQFLEDIWFVGTLTAGFGLQIGLFTYLRGLHSRAGAVGMATSTGTSAAAMLACCAHHLADVLPVLGVAGATAFLGAYKAPLLWLGISMNLAGVAYLLRQVRKARSIACPTVPGNAAARGEQA